MHLIKCELCGSPDIVKDGDFYVCQYCHAEYSPEAAEKLTAKTDNPIPISIVRMSNVENLLQRADEFTLEGDEKKAAECYNWILDIDPSNEKAGAWLLEKKKQDEVKTEAIRKKTTISLTIAAVVFFLVCVLLLLFTFTTYSNLHR